MSHDPKTIRNFSIIAHIDHGKSTLADRLLEYTGTVPALKMREQVMDPMELVQAQTLANLHLALEQHLAAIPVINKIDLPIADVAAVRQQMEETHLIDTSGTILCSAKEGIGTREVFEAIVASIPPPQGDAKAPLKALVFDSWFDPFHGVVAMIRVVDGSVQPGLSITLMATGATFAVSQVGQIRPEMQPVAMLRAGEVGYCMAGMKDVRQVRVGDTITEADRPVSTPLPGFREVRPMVFAGLYPVDGGEYLRLKDALEKLRLNDSAFTVDPESSAALGFGFRCGFLGLLHLEIVQERLEREFDLELLTTAPTVVYPIRLTDGRTLEIDNPSRLPSRERVSAIEEPYIRAVIMAPGEHIGPILALCQEKRGVRVGLEYLQERRAVLTYDLPLAGVVLDFYDRLKSLTRGDGSPGYWLVGYREGDLVKLDILVNGEPVDALSAIVERDQAYQQGRQLVARLRELIPRQLFEVVLQAAIGGKVIARESIKPLRKQVTAHLYGGDVTRKRKLLERQKEGKKRMKQLGRVEIPQEAFMAVLNIRGEQGRLRGARRCGED